VTDDKDTVRASAIAMPLDRAPVLSNTKTPAAEVDWLCVAEWLADGDCEAVGVGNCDSDAVPDAVPDKLGEADCDGVDEPVAETVGLGVPERERVWLLLLLGLGVCVTEAVDDNVGV
jgi:hypothetical protein